jgi:phosphoglycolate phosphatase-like HAD superfamily hydrolase
VELAIRDRENLWSKPWFFDIDGTIVDSVDLHAKAWQRTFAKFGKNIFLEAIRSQIGKGADQLLPVYFSKQELDQFGEAMEFYRGELFKKEYFPKVKGFPKVRQLFEQIRWAKNESHLASSAKEDELTRYKEIAQINDVIAGETSFDDVERSKPCPDVFESSLKQLGNITPDRVIVVGDIPYDAAAAAKANVNSIGLLCSGWTQPQLLRAGCIAVYRDPADLLARYEKSPLRNQTQLGGNLSTL